MFRAGADVEGIGNRGGEPEGEQTGDRHLAKHREVDAHAIRQALQEAANFLGGMRGEDAVAFVGVAKHLKKILEAFKSRFDSNYALAPRRANRSDLPAAVD